MYNLTLQQLIDILGQAGYTSAIAQLQEHSIHAENIETIEIDYEVQEKNTVDEYTEVNEFNIFLKTNTVFFGIHTKHGDDMDIQWSRRNPVQHGIPHG